MITSMMGRMADAEKLSIPQLQMAIKNGTIPAYVGVPLLQDKVKQRQQAMAMQQAQQQQGQDQVPLAAQVMQEADQYRGIDELPTNLPTEEDERAVNDEYANGGIIAFADTGAVKEPKKSFWDTVDPAKYQADPAYKAFVDESGETDKTYKNYLKLGNTPPLTEKELDDARYKNARAVEDAYYASPEGKQAEIQAQQMGEIQPVLPSKVSEQYYTEMTNDPKLSTRVVEDKMGLGSGDLARMRGEDKPILSSIKEGASNLYDKILGPQGISSILPEGKAPIKYAQTNSPIPGLTGIANSVKDAAMTTPLGRTVVDKVSGINDIADKIALRVKLAEQYGPMALGTASGSNADQAMARQILDRLPNMSMEELNALAKQKGLPSSQVTLPAGKMPNRMSEAEAAQAEMLRAEAASPMGVAALPAAQNVRTSPNQSPAGQRGAAPTTAPNSNAGAGTTTSAGGSRGNGAGGDVPSTLKEAEAIASKSPAAAQAVSEVDRYMAMLEKSGESVGREKKEAFYMALIQGGLGMMGGTSPNAFANISAGLLPATQAYQQAIAGIRKDDRARVEKLLAAGMGKEKLALELRKLGIEEKKVDALVNFYNAKAGAAGSGGSAAADKLSLLEQKQLEAMELKARQEVRAATTAMNKDLANNTTYQMNLRLANTSKDPKQKAEALATVNSIKQPYLDLINDAREYANVYSTRRRDTTGETDTSGSSGNITLPKGIPTGSRLAGKSGGKDVYEAPDSKRYIVD